MKTMTCKFCGATALLPPSQNRRKKYCSDNCSANGRKRARAFNIPGRCKELATGAKHRAKSKGIAHDISGEYLLSIWEEQGGCCALSKVPFDLSYDEGLQKGWSKKNAPSVDRITPNLGYTVGNVRLVTHQVNSAKGSYTDEDLMEMARRLLKGV